ncbi:hypothetical protein DFH94DRAFT_678041 [Russula ochroleuca]|uniref:Uncharacterized protein n=1 Tax=Russula ochroleuca TaxID=152965 RepID=A0A9P5TE76_9AGAM|nr:hypothetical protein DFH94DRAFT_678041 [Russula ochroleuca]
MGPFVNSEIQYMLRIVARLRCTFSAGDLGGLEVKGDLVENLKDEEKALSLGSRRVLNEADRIRQEKTSGQSKDCLRNSSTHGKPVCTDPDYNQKHVKGEYIHMLCEEFGASQASYVCVCVDKGVLLACTHHRGHPCCVHRGCASSRVSCMCAGIEAAHRQGPPAYSTCVEAVRMLRLWEEHAEGECIEGGALKQRAGEGRVGVPPCLRLGARVGKGEGKMVKVTKGGSGDVPVCLGSRMEGGGCSELLKRRRQAGFVPACLENDTWRYSCVGTESSTIGAPVDDEHVGQHKMHEHKQ